MRVFAAIPLSYEVREGLAAYEEALRRMGVSGRFAPPENLHLTLAFPGEVKDPAPVIRALSRIKVPSFSIALSSPGSFGDLIYAGMADRNREGALSRLAGSVRTALAEEHVAFDEKPFVPHVTLVRRARFPKGLPALPDISMRVTRICLFRSEEKNGRRIYTEVYRR